MDDKAQITGWQEWMSTNEGRGCAAPAPRTSDEGTEYILSQAFYAGVAWAEAHQAATLRKAPSITEPDLDELCDVIERLRQRVHDQTNQTQITARQIHAKVLLQINVHGGLPEGIGEYAHPIEQLVGTVLSLRDGEIKRLKLEVAESAEDEALTAEIARIHCAQIGRLEKKLAEAEARKEVARSDTEPGLRCPHCNADVSPLVGIQFVNYGKKHMEHPILCYCGSLLTVKAVLVDEARQKEAAARSAQDVAKTDSDS